MALPGVRAQLIDQFSALRYRDQINTPRVLCIGRKLSAGNAVLYDPQKYETENAVVTAFGSASELHKAWIELTQCGATDIYLEAIHATNDRFDELEAAYQTAETILPDIIVPYGVGTDSDGSQPSDGAYANVIATDDITSEEHTVVSGGFVVDYPYSISDVTVTSDDATPVPYVEDSDYSFDAATGVFVTIEGGDISDGASVLVSYTYSGSYANQLATWCERFTDLGIPCIGVIGCQPLEKAVEDADDYINEAQKQTELATLITALPDKEEDLGDRGKFISVVLGETKIVGQDSDWGFNDGACPYAALMASLQPQSAPTNKTLYNVSAIRYRLSRSQLETLVNLNLAPINVDPQQRAMVVDAPTYSPEGSDYWRLTTMRIAVEAMKQVALVAQKYIGEGATVARRNALETAIRGTLQNMKSAGALNDADFFIQFYPLSNSATVDLILRPAWEIRTITETVTIRTD